MSFSLLFFLTIIVQMSKQWKGYQHIIEYLRAQWFGQKGKKFEMWIYTAHYQKNVFVKSLWSNLTEGSHACLLLLIMTIYYMPWIGFFLIWFFITKKYISVKQSDRGKSCMFAIVNYDNLLNAVNWFFLTWLFRYKAEYIAHCSNWK